MVVYPYQKSDNQYFPVIKLFLIYKDSKLTIEALVDSGANISIFGADIAESLGINVESGKEVYLSGMTDKTPENYEKEIARSDLLTSKEHEFIGGTREEGWSQDDVPIAIINGESIERVAQLRKEKLAQFTSDILGFAAGYGKTLVIQFSADLDLKTGKVLAEPHFIGFWDNKDGKFLPAEDPDELDREAKERLKKLKEKRK